jgi:hypothetical protein
MPEFILNAGLELPLILILLALLGFRRKVNPRASVLVRAPPDKVFALVDLHDGKVQNWNRTTVTSELVDVARRFSHDCVTTLSTAASAPRRFRGRTPRPNYLELRREGLEENPQQRAAENCHPRPSHGTRLT